MLWQYRSTWAIIILFCGTGIRPNPSLAEDPSDESSDSNCPDGVCGPENAIINGEEAIPNQYPWLVTIQRENEHICGGILISPKLVLSAAHCFFDKQKGNTFTPAPVITVLLGVHSLNDARNNTFESPVRQILVHPYYRISNRNADYDIALLELAGSTKCLDSNAKISFIKLPSATQSFGDIANQQSLKVAGWGMTKKGEKVGVKATNPADTLKKARAYLISYKECKNRWEPEFSVTSYILCTDSEKTDICQGDSGGPMFLDYSGTARQSELIGVVSRSSPGCGVSTPDRKKSASIFTRVSKFMDSFILPEMKRVSQASDKPTCTKDTPWAVSILTQNRHLCSGAQIGPAAILTAGSCLFDNKTNKQYQEENLGVRFGLPDLNWGRRGAFFVDKVVVHPYFRISNKNRDFDLALIIISPPTSTDKVLQLPPADQSVKSLMNKPLIWLGWDSNSNILRRIPVTVIPYETGGDDCKERANKMGVQITGNTFCVEAKEATACELDIGGPIVMNTAVGKDVVVGIVSWNDKRCSTPLTIIASRVSKFLPDFIQPEMKKIVSQSTTTESSDGLIISV